MHKTSRSKSLLNHPSPDHFDSLSSDSFPITLGICAMDKKAQSSPMKEILKHINPEEIKIIFFNEEMFLKSKPSTWPVVDALISFYSEGFPISKIQKYSLLRKPMLINDISKQELLWDRSLIYKELKKAGIPTPNHFFVYGDRQEDLISKYKYNVILANERINKNKKRSFDKNGNIQNFLIKCHEEMKKIRKGSHCGENVKSYKSLKGVEWGMIKSNNSSENIKRTLTSSLLMKLPLNKKKNKIPSEPTQHLHLENIISLHDDSKHSENQDSPYDSYSSPTSSLINQSKSKIKLCEDYIIEEFDDHIIINDIKVNKPFVEKPFDAENHDINIYYPINDGGGCKKLFRKIGNVSSKFDSTCNEIRRNGNYIYEEFLPTDGFDIKVYTVGPDYAHAEARKSPVLDGKVQRTVTGKEVRYPVTLTPEEKIIARKISLWFGQNVCGFDLLRSKGVSYVCDVNGWSFVKGNTNYYRDCALMLRHMILLKFAPIKLNNFIIRPIKIINDNNKSEMESHMVSSFFRPEINERTIYAKEELRSVVAIFRHGDRTPKQKMKMKIKDARFLEFFDNEQDPMKEIVIKKAVLLQRILDITRVVLDEINNENQFDSDEDHDTSVSKLYQLVSVLEKGGHFEEMNRKIQIKPLKWKETILPNGESQKKVIEALFIIKWGGELTHSGESQAETLGQLFRTYLYPNENEGILRLHSTYRHDLKTYSSDEGRCLKTAGAFCKGFLKLEGELTPIVVSMVRKDDVAQDLLDLRNHKLDLSDTMKILSDVLNSEGTLEENLKKFINLSELTEAELSIIRNIKEPLKLMQNLLTNIRQLTKSLRFQLNLKNKTYYINPLDMKLNENEQISEEEKAMITCGQENLILVFKRWRKLEIDFFDNRKNIFNISKILDIYDSISFDMTHNFKFFGNLEEKIGFKICEYSELLAFFLTPNEYGLDKNRKCDIGISITNKLFNKIKTDLIWWNTLVAESKENYGEEMNYWMIRNMKKGLQSSFKDTTPLVKSKWRHIRTRLYFTSASHLYSMLNVIKFGSGGMLTGENKTEINKINFLNYLSHFVFRLFENLGADANDPQRFRLELHVSCGNLFKRCEEFKNHKVPIGPLILINKNLTLVQLEEFFKQLNTN